jgi:2-isopropylmalate synthase
MKRIQLYDTTLRDGAQAEDISFTLEDKLRIAERLDDLGVAYIEGGWPGSNPRDEEFFRAVKGLNLKSAKVAAFGSTRRTGVKAADDRNLALCLRAGTPVVTIVGKTWDLHVRDDLRIPLEENLEVIADSISWLRQHVDEVIFDAEHFFDGLAANRDYALAAIKAAADAGATLVCLCDTRGGSLSESVAAGVDAGRAAIGTPLGIHCHNDCELAVANSIAGVEHGCIQVQGTINGFGERCGNANLVSVIPALQLKGGYQCVTPAQLKTLADVSHFVYELANLEPNKRQPFVGQSAFAHKGGLHVAAVQKNPETYEHIDPDLVGNTQRVLVSDLSGRSNLLYKAQEFGVDLESNAPAVKALLEELKDLEARGFAFEGAEASFELLMRKALDGDRMRHFRLIGFRVIDEKRVESEPSDVRGDDHARGTGRAGRSTRPRKATARERHRPALRKALGKFYPEVEQVHLLDYKVRVLGRRRGDRGDGPGADRIGRCTERWGTVGVSPNVVEASWQALVDSMDYKLYKDRRGPIAGVAPDVRNAAENARSLADAHLPRPQRGRAALPGGSRSDARVARDVRQPVERASRGRSGAERRRGGARRRRGADRCDAGGDRLHERRERGEQPGARAASHGGLVTTAIEHASVLETAHVRAAEGARRSSSVSIARAAVAATRCSRPDATTRLASVGLANGEVGIGRAARGDRAGLVGPARPRPSRDAAQAAGGCRSTSGRSASISSRCPPTSSGARRRRRALRPRGLALAAADDRRSAGARAARGNGERRGHRRLRRGGRAARATLEAGGRDGRASSTPVERHRSAWAPCATARRRPAAAEHAERELPGLHGREPARAARPGRDRGLARLRLCRRRRRAVARPPCDGPKRPEARAGCASASARTTTIAEIESVLDVSRRSWRRCGPGRRRDERRASG